MELLTALDPRMPDVRVEFGIARAEVARSTVNRAQAEQLSAIAATLREAREFPEIFLGPTFLPASEAAAFAERAAVADLAVRLNLSEGTVRAQAHEAETLRSLTPRVWEAFREGEISPANAGTVAMLVIGLPDPSAFDEAVVDPAMQLAPARFKQMARALRERLVDEPAVVRHERAAEARRVIIENDLDGMAWLHAYLPADAAHRAMANVNRMAKSLSKAKDETRTMAQLRADVTTDLLAGVLGAKGSVGVIVGVTVPVLTLLGGDEHGILEGHGPIDAATARRLAAHAPSFHRILTHPVTSAILDLDRTTYKVPADLKRLVQIRDVVCTFAGCGRPARECDIDHTRAWADDGTTAEANLADLCRHHHRIKHETLWSVARRNGVSTWRSPTGAIRTSDPPPY